MRDSITQEAPNGCGIACFAFVCDLTYKQATKFLGPEQTSSNRFIVRHMVEELGRFGRSYKAKHVKPGQQIEPKNNSIVLIRRSKDFPVGHYLAYYQNQWMDPRINLQQDWEFKKPVSGFRDRLPGEAMYLISPV